MSSYEDTKKACYACYPSLFTCESDILDNLFFVIGNGYDWVDGELSDGQDDLTLEERIKHSREGDRKFYEQAIAYSDARKPELTDWLAEYFGKKLEQLEEKDHIEKEQAREQKRRTQFAELNEEDVFVEDGIYKYSIYPLSRYSKLCELPDDIKPDWLAAAKKALAYGKKNYRREEGREWFAKIEARIGKLEL